MGEAAEKVEPDITGNITNRFAHLAEVAEYYIGEHGSTVHLTNQHMPTTDTQRERSRWQPSLCDTMVEHESTVCASTAEPAHSVPSAQLSGAPQCDVPKQRNSTVSQDDYTTYSVQSGIAQHKAGVQMSGTPDSAVTNQAAMPSNNTMDVASILLSLQQQVAHLNATIITQHKQAESHMVSPTPVSEPIAVPRVEQQVPPQAPHQLSPEWRRSAFNTFNPTHLTQDFGDREVPTQAHQVNMLVNSQETKRFPPRYEPAYANNASRAFRDYSQGDGRGHITGDLNRNHDSCIPRSGEQSWPATAYYPLQLGPEKWAKKPHDLPKYFGNDFGISPVEFLNKFEKAVMCVSAIGLDEALARWMPACLEGAVSTWYELELRVNQRIKSWTGFRKAFMAEFAPNYENMLRQDFERRRQYSDETATGFIAAMDKYINIIYPTADEEFKIKMILYKMNPKFRAAMSRERFETLGGMLACARRVQSEMILDAEYTEPPHPSSFYEPSLAYHYSTTKMYCRQKYDRSHDRHPQNSASPSGDDSSPQTKRKRYENETHVPREEHGYTTNTCNTDKYKDRENKRGVQRERVSEKADTRNPCPDAKNLQSPPRS